MLGRSETEEPPTLEENILITSTFVPEMISFVVSPTKRTEPLCALRRGMFVCGEGGSVMQSTCVAN